MTINNKIISITDNEYKEWLIELKHRYKQSQIKAAVKVNSELLQFYWSLGRDIVKMKSDAKWGGRFYETLAKDLKELFPNTTGFSIRNLQYMKQFYELFPAVEITQQVAAQIENEITQQVAAQIFCIPWGHLCLIISKANNNRMKALFYINETIKNNWSRDVLSTFLDTNLFERQGKAINNFEYRLPKENSDLAKQITKDPYNFDFLALKDEYNERELKDALIDNIQKFLIELGTGFAYMGKEYRLQIGDSEEFLDMLFYNTTVHAYVVVEVKTKDFKPGDIGQLGTYVVAVDHILKSEKDAKTIGLLVCKNKNEVLARYGLESSSQPLGISSFELSKLIPENFKSSLPTIEEIENELKDK